MLIIVRLGFHAPLDTYMELAKFGAQKVIETNRPINVCVGKEWHRFPSSFFLPDNRYLSKSDDFILLADDLF